MSKTRVKICGVSTLEVVEAAIAAGADLLGFVHFARSPRHVSLEAAAALMAHAKALGRVETVLLLVDPSDDLLDAVERTLSPDILQLHGHETPARVEAVARRGRWTVWKACPVASRADVASAVAYHAPGTRADLVLFDAKPPADPAALPGGNGLAFDWRILDSISGRMPFALAGGLTPENVADAIQLTGPDIVDVSSGVECRPGVKSLELVRRFIAAAGSAERPPRPSMQERP